MRITVLGSASGLAVPHRNPSAYLLEVEHHLYLIDAGDGVARQLVRYRVDPKRIACIFISHTHPDHAAGLFFLLQLMHLSNRRDPLCIYLPQDLLPGFHTIFPYFQIYPGKWPFRFDLLPISEGVVMEDKGFQLSAIPNDHLMENRHLADKSGSGVDSFSFHFSEGKKGDAFYTSDVNSLTHLRAVSSRVDVLISECTHLEIEEIIDFAHSAGIPKVILTHIPPELEGSSLSKKKQHKNIMVEFAEDGYVIEV
jgi:ribonuclease BN (tRNA processing enzyme)